ncbi:hypothetical protein K8R33_01740 [archaeon]|nr:hypothetical protein [archaeon]
MKYKLAIFSFLSMIFGSSLVSADNFFIGDSFFGGGADQLKLNINFMALKDPSLWAVLAAVALIGFILFILALKIPFFEGNKRWAGGFAFLLALISITLSPVVYLVMLLGVVGGVIVSLFAIFVIIYSMFVLTKGFHVDSKVVSREKGLEDKQSKIETKEEEERLEDKHRYKRVIKQIRRIIKRVKKLDVNDPNFLDDCKDLERGDLDTTRQRLDGDREGDSSGDGDDAYDELNKAANDLRRGDKSSVDRRLDEAVNLLRAHKRP